MKQIRGAFAWLNNRLHLVNFEFLCKYIGHWLHWQAIKFPMRCQVCVTCDCHACAKMAITNGLSRSSRGGGKHHTIIPSLNTLMWNHLSTSLSDQLGYFHFSNSLLPPRKMVLNHFAKAVLSVYTWMLWTSSFQGDPNCSRKSPLFEPKWQGLWEISAIRALERHLNDQFFHKDII